MSPTSYLAALPRVRMCNLAVPPRPVNMVSWLLNADIAHAQLPAMPTYSRGMARVPRECVGDQAERAWADRTRRLTVCLGRRPRQ
jgi:hypothetical protein